MLCSRILRLILLVVVAAAVSSASLAQELSNGLAANEAADTPSEKTERLVTGFYDVSLLVASQQPLLSVGDSLGNHLVPFQSGGITSKGGFGGGGMGGIGGIGGGNGGFGGGGQGGIGGGGFYCLPAEPIQFGGGSAGGGQGYQVVRSAVGSAVDAGFISSLIERVVAPETWSTSGGKGDVTSFGNILIIRQTEAVHAEIEQILKTLTETVVTTKTWKLEAWWLPVREAAQIQLNAILNGPLEESAVVEQLATLCQNESGYHGTMLCREHVATSMASGKQIPVIVGSTPIVGTGSSGDKPEVQVLHLGLLLEARVNSVPWSPTANAGDSDGERLDFNFSCQLTGRDAKVQDWDKAGKIDRYVLGRHCAEGFCRIQTGNPTLVASLTQLSNSTDDVTARPELQLVIRMTRVND